MRLAGHGTGVGSLLGTRGQMSWGLLPESPANSPAALCTAEPIPHMDSGLPEKLPRLDVGEGALEAWAVGEPGSGGTPTSPTQEW